MKQPTRFVGMDVHKETIVVAVTASGEVGKATAYGTFPNTTAALEKLVKRLRQAGSGRSSSVTKPVPAATVFTAPSPGWAKIAWWSHRR